MEARNTIVMNIYGGLTPCLKLILQTLAEFLCPSFYAFMSLCEKKKKSGKLRAVCSFSGPNRVIQSHRQRVSITKESGHSENEVLRISITKAKRSFAALRMTNVVISARGCVWSQ